MDPLPHSKKRKEPSSPLEPVLYARTMTRPSLVTHCIEYLDERQRPKRKPIEKPVRKGHKTCRRCLSQRDMERVLILRFGSLKSNHH